MLLSSGVVEVLLGKCVQRRKRLHLGQVLVRDRKASLLFGKCTAIGVERGLERLRVLQKHDLTRLDHAALGVYPLLEKAVDARDDLHLMRALRLAYILKSDRSVTRRDHDRRDFRGECPFRRRVVLRATDDPSPHHDRRQYPPPVGSVDGLICCRWALRQHFRMLNQLTAPS